MTHPQHHAHIRKRMYKHLEEYPHPNLFKRFLDKSIFIIGVLGPIMTIPQVVQIWFAQNAAGVSLLSWISYFVFAGFWLTYGIVHKEEPIILSNVLALLVNGVVVVGVVLY